MRVEVVEGPDKGVVLETRDETLTVGTADDNVLVLHDPLVSRYHLRVSASAEGLRLVDSGSSNGTPTRSRGTTTDAPASSHSSPS